MENLNVLSDNGYSLPIITFEEYKYVTDTESIKIENNTIKLTSPSCTITCSYEQGEGDELKCYQFYLYKIISDTNEYLIGGTERIYASSAPIFACENLNDESQYRLEFYCTSQSGNTVYSDGLIINTKYEATKAYGNLFFNLDKTNAENTVFAELIELTGEADNQDIDITYIENKEVDLTDNGVTFTDQYNLMTNNFLCRLWLRDVKSYVDILTLTDGNDIVRVQFYRGEFHAFKESCGLITHYISNSVQSTQKMYLAFGYYNGRIELYAKDI